MAPFLDGKRALAPDLPLLQRLPVLRLPPSGKMPLDRGLEVTVQKLSGAPLILRAQTFFMHRTAAAVPFIRPVFPEQAAAAAVQPLGAENVSVWANVDVPRSVIDESVPFERRLGTVMDWLWTDKEINTQLLQNPVCQRKVKIGRAHV